MLLLLLTNRKRLYALNINMTKPKNVPPWEWRLRCNAKYASQREYVSRRNAKHRAKNPTMHMHAEAKKRAKKAGPPFNIELSDITIPVLCPLLAIPILSDAGKRKFSDHSPSLDRIRNDLGYVKGNVRVISDLANRMKRNATPEQLRTFAISILLEQGFLELDC